MKNAPEPHSRPAEDLGAPAGGRIRNYVIRRELGRGGGGRVFEAFDPNLIREVAIKQVRGSLVDEARTQARLAHPAIPRIYDTLTIDGEDYIVSELARGVPLSALLAERDGRGGLPIPLACELLAGVTSALAHAHGAGVLHRDVKPDNILVDDRRVKLVDFGLARNVGELDAGDSAASEVLVGTPRYMSPEQSRGSPVDERSDIFSLGVCFYEVLGGVNPFAGVDAAATLQNLGSVSPPSLRQLRPAVPEELAQLVARMLEKQPSDRPTADAVERALVRIREQWRPSIDGAISSSTRQVAVAVVRFPSTDEGPRTADTREDVAALAEAQRRIAESVEEAGGCVFSSAGRHVAFVIGHPESHDNNAERAARLLLQTQGLAGATGSKGVARGGSALALGPVEVLTHENRTAVLGDLVDETIELAFAANPGEVLVTTPAANALARAFEIESGLPPRALARGRNITVARLGQERAPDEHFARARLVGRERPLARLDAAWATAARGRGKAVLVVGEAGIGKSRLVSEWAARLGDSPRRLAMTGLEQARYAPFQPVCGLVTQLLGLEGDAGRDVVQAALSHRGMRHEQWTDALGSLFSASDAGSPDLSRKALHDRVAAAVASLLSEVPCVLVVEDVHWMDASTLYVLERLSALARRTELLLVLTARQEIDDRWRVARDIERIELTRLDDEDAETMLEAIGVSRKLPIRLAQAIVQRADGVPLVLEQLALAVMSDANESAVGSGGLERLPTTLRDSVQSRLERLGPARRTLEGLAVLGDEAPEALLLDVLGMTSAALDAHYAEARRCDLVGHGGPRAFRHTLIRDAVYDCIESSRRRELHARVVDALEQRLPTLLESAPGLFARHFEVAGKVSHAVDLWEAAGFRAQSRWAYEEAARNMQSARRVLLTYLPEGAERDRRERAMLDVMIGALQDVESWSADSIPPLSQRREQINERFGDRPNLKTLWSDWVMRLTLHDDAGLRASFEAIQRAGDSVSVRFIHDFAVGVTAYHRGDLVRARAHLVPARDAVFAALDHTVRPDNALDVEAVRLCAAYLPASPSLYLAVLEMCLGRFGSAERHLLEAEDVARRFESKHAMAFVLGTRTIHALVRHDTSCVRASLSRLEALCEHSADFAYGLAQLGMAKALVAVEEGRAPEGAAEHSRALTWLQGFKVSSELHFAACADAHREAGDLDEAQRAIDMALGFAEHELAGIYAPEAYLAAARLSRARDDASSEAAYLDRARVALAAIRTGDDEARVFVHHLATHGRSDAAPFVSLD